MCLQVFVFLWVRWASTPALAVSRPAASTPPLRLVDPDEGGAGVQLLQLLLGRGTVLEAPLPRLLREQGCLPHTSNTSTRGDPSGRAN